MVLQLFKKIKKGSGTIVIPILFSVVIFTVWELLVFLLEIPEYLLPPPSTIFNELGTNFSILLGHMAMTMLAAVSGYLLANGIGFCAGVIFAHSKTIEKGIYPYAIALKTTPVIAMAPLLVLWFGTDLESKIATAALICFFPIIVNSVKGLTSVDRDSLDLFKSYSASKWQIFIKLRLRTSLPYVFSALKISTGLSVVGAVVGEFVGANVGIGYLILVSSYHLETATMFAAIMMSALGGVTFFTIVSLIEKKVIFWQRALETS